MNKILIALFAASAATLSLGAYADDDTMTHTEAGAAKAQAKADYKADKAQAKADYHANKADCERHTEGAVERACKHAAQAPAKVDKADAKLDYKQDKAAIKSATKSAQNPGCFDRSPRGRRRHDAHRPVPALSRLRHDAGPGHESGHHTRREKLPCP